MNFTELPRNLPITDRLQEVAENRFRLRMHVGATVGSLERLKSIDRFLLCHRIDAFEDIVKAAANGTVANTLGDGRMFIFPPVLSVVGWT